MRVFAWIKWERISFLKRWGGWGLKDLFTFSSALAAKVGWRLISSNSILTEITVSKYIYTLSRIDWIHLDNKYTTNIYNIWKVVLTSFNIIEFGLAWRIGSGSHAIIDIDPWFGCRNRFTLPQEFFLFLSSKGIKTVTRFLIWMLYLYGDKIG